MSTTIEWEPWYNEKNLKMPSTFFWISSHLCFLLNNYLTRKCRWGRIFAFGVQFITKKKKENLSFVPPLDMVWESNFQPKSKIKKKNHIKHFIVNYLSHQTLHYQLPITSHICHQIIITSHITSSTTNHIIHYNINYQSLFTY